MARGLPASVTLLVTFALLTRCLISAAARAELDKDVVQMHGSVVSDYPVGDPRRCQELARKNGYTVQTFEVLPGGGWDNLRNVEEGQVVHFNYSQCRTTQDGRFLLPNSVNAVPVKTSNVQTFAELISHWKDWTSTNSKSINVEAGLSLSKFSFSGKFSSDFQDMKSKQIGDKSVTTRTQLRYIRYGVQLQPDTPLHPVFRDRVLDIAAAQELGQKERARYLSQLLVRDFGTHIVTKADAGASLEQVDQVKEDFVKIHTDKKSDILASASASLFSVFHMSASYETKTDKSFTDQYQHSRTSSSIRTKGGPLFRPANFTPDSWATEVDSDLVAMDRSGDPLYYVLTTATLSELPASTLNEVTDRVREAVETYYSYNAIPGCLDSTSPNFSPAANTEDGSCKPPPTNLTFGGVYQTCSMNPGYNNGDLCGNHRQVNPLTGGFSCPPKYRAVTLHSGTTATSRSEHRCHGWWLWKKCHDDYYRSEATYTMNWCVATEGVPPRSGYLFGGLFTAQVVNPVTQASSCPPAFFPLSIGSAVHLHVCISDDFEFGENYALPFAGFLSCQAGNPLAVSQQAGSAQGLRKARSADGPGGQQRSSLKEFFKDEADDWPMRCPDGFSRHLATVDQGCQISYCVQTGSMRGPVLTPIKRPPFMPTPPLPAPPSQNLVIFDPATNTWKRNEEATQMLTLNPSSATAKGLSSDADDDAQSMSPGTAAGISIAATLGCVLLTTGAVLAVRAKRRKGSAGYRRLEDPLLSPRQSYGSGGASGPAPDAVTGAAVSVNLDGADNQA